MENDIQLFSLTDVVFTEKMRTKDGLPFFQLILEPQVYAGKAYTKNVFAVAKTGEDGMPELDEEGRKIFTWKNGSPERLRALMAQGGKVQGKVVNVATEPYTIGSGEQQRVVDSYTAFLFPHERVETVLKASGLTPRQQSSEQEPAAFAGIEG